MTNILKILSGYQYNFASEADLQNGVAAAFTLNHVIFEREYRLGPKDRPDFFLPQFELAIEVKIKFSRSEVLRQLFRYAEYDEVKALLLVTARSCHSIPETLNSKPVSVLNISRL